MINLGIKYFLRYLRDQYKLLTSLSEIREVQNIINLKKNQSFKIIALVICNAGQQQFFKDIYKLSLEENQNFYFFFVNDYQVADDEILGVFKGVKFITPNVYRHLSNIDIALHAEIHCRSYGVKDVCFTGHGFPGKHTNWSAENINSFNHYFLYGPKDRKILDFVTRGNKDLLNHIRFWEIGYPKYDDQINNAYELNSIKSNLQINFKNPTVLYAPAWDPGSSLRKYGIQLINIFGKMQNLNIIIKLHPASIVSKESADYEFYTGGVNWVKVIKESSNKFKNIHLYSEVEINPLFKLADVMLTDFSGVALGFFLEDKPVVCIDCPEYYSDILGGLGSDGEESKNNSLFNNGRDACYVVEDLLYLEDTLMYAIKNKNEMSPKRSSISTDLLYNPGKGSVYMLNAIKSILYN